ncbi:hypothetical protein EON80_13690, partial [bacterium]
QAGTGTNPSPWGYVGTQGYMRDSSERLYVRARHYRPATTRWTTVDPLWPDESAYGYASNVPAILTDSFGLSPNQNCPTHGGYGKRCVYSGPTGGESDPAYWQCYDPYPVKKEDCIDCLSRINLQVRGSVGQVNFGIVNALRHCIGACAAKQQCGSACAPAIFLHEIPGIKDPGDVGCDSFNNIKGFGIAGSAGIGNCHKGCKAALAKGDLCILPAPNNRSIDEAPIFPPFRPGR